MFLSSLAQGFLNGFAGGLMNRSHMTMSGQKENGLPRRLGLALVLSLLGVLLAIITADAYVAKKTETTLADFDTGRFIYTGLLDLPPEVDSVQLLPIGLTGNWGTSDKNLPMRLANLAAIANANTIYAVGGTDNNLAVRNEVYSSQMGARGALSPWESQNSLPQARAGSGIASHALDEDASMLYILGGFDDDVAPTNTIYRAQIDNASGQIGTWSTDALALPYPLYYASVVEHNDALYIIGGFGGVSSDAPQAGVYYTPIAPNGSLGSFVPTSSLPEPLYNGFAVVYEGDTTDTVYVVGGFSVVTSTYQVYFADFLPGGGLTAWQSSDGKLPMHLYAHAGVLIDGGEILATGGIANDLDPTLGISNTVKAALVDVDNASFRLYDWCQGRQPPDCTIGAWQTGALLPAVRALHAAVASHGYIYVLGGIDSTQKPQNTVFFGTVTGVGAIYSPKGYYQSEEMDFGQLAALRRLDWDVTIGHPGQMGLTMQYRTAAQEGAWSNWSSAVHSISGTNQIVLDPPVLNVHYFQFQANFTTSITDASPLLDRVEVFYEVPDPEVAVSKDSGDVISVTNNSDLGYTIYYTNNGGWTAQDVVLTETVPAEASYVGGPQWQRVGATNVYTYLVGDLEWGASGNTTFQTRVNDAVAQETLYITNHVQIGFPPMIDAFAQTIVDPEPDNNLFEFGNPYLPYAITITKEYSTTSGNLVVPNQRISYTLTYSNPKRSVPATGVYVLDQLPDYTTYVSGSIFGPGADDSDPALLRWDLATVWTGQSGQLGYAVTVDNTAPDGAVLSNGADLHSEVALPRSSNSVTNTVDAKYNLAVTKTAVPPTGSTVMPGSSITYTVCYTNLGTVAASQAYILDQLPEHTTYVPGSIFGPGADDSDPSQLRWDLATIFPGQSDELGYAVTVDELTPEGTVLTNKAEILSDMGLPKSSNSVTATVMLRVYKLEVTKSAVPAPGSVVTPGSFITYTISYTNSGSMPASQVVVTDTYDSAGSYSIVSVDPPAHTENNVWRLGPLEPEEKGSITIRARLNDTFPDHWQVSNRASLSSPEGLPRYTSVVTHEVVNPPTTALSNFVVKNIRMVPAEPEPGQPVDIYATLSNEGALDADQYFWTALYIKTSPSAPPAGPSDHAFGYCLNNCSIVRPYHLHYVANLASGQSIEISFSASGQKPSFPAEGTYDIYVQADVAFDDPYYNPYWGVYPEEDEANNIAHTVVVLEGPPRTYLPAILKKWP
jgi:uncharacterized repeat protein (TIGR01451 family)